MKDVNAILTKLDQTLYAAKLGLDDILNGPTERKAAGLKNLTVWGTAVTHVLQNLREKGNDDFDNWYGPIKQEMSGDELLRYFYKRRSEHLKQGELKVVRVGHVNDLSELQKLPKPDNAVGFFIGDENGGAGWEIVQSDGSKEKFYVDIPPEFGNAYIRMIDPPTHHLGEEIKDVSIENLSNLYYQYFKLLVDKAHKDFEK